jgi:hypothetical protein
MVSRKDRLSDEQLLTMHEEIASKLLQIHDLFQEAMVPLEQLYSPSSNAIRVINVALRKTDSLRDRLDGDYCAKFDGHSPYYQAHASG